MPEALVIRLGEGEDDTAAAIVSSDGVAPGRVQHGKLSELAGLATDRKVYVLLPATEVLLTEATVPVRGAAKILQAVPYALEEHLAEDVSRLHFAVGKRGPQNRTPVAVIAYARLEARLAELAAEGIQPNVVLSEGAVLPVVEPGAVVLLEDGRALVGCAGQPPLSCAPRQLEELLDICGLSVAGEQAKEQTGSRLVVYATRAQRQQLGALIERLSSRVAEVELHELGDDALPFFAEHAVELGDPINLLQGAFAPKTAVDKLWQPWRAAAMLAIAFVAAALGVKAVQLFELRATETSLDAAIAQLLQEVCQVSSIIDPRRQMQRCVDQRTGASGTQDEVFLDMLATVSDVLAETPNTRVEQLSFRNRVLDLKLTAPDIETLDRIKRLVADRGGLEMDIERTNPSEGLVQSQVEIRKPAA